MRQLLPEPANVDPAEAYGRIGRIDGRPSVRLNMVASVDGAAYVDGRSGGLAGPADKALFATLRSLADVVLVGAATLRAENYGPARLDEAARARRRTQGLSETPPIAVLTRVCELDFGSPFFVEAEARPVVITTAAAAAGRGSGAGAVADVIVAGEQDVDLAIAIAALGQRGHENVLCEGGPRVGGQLAAAGVLDELCLTVSPRLVGGEARRILDGAGLVPPTALELAGALEADGFLFLRYRRT